MEQTDQIIEPKKISVARNAMNYGAILGVALIVLSLLFYILSINEQGWVSWVQVAILITGLAFGTINYRNHVCGGFISYGKSLGSSVLIGFFASVLLGIYVYIYFKFIDPGSVDKILSLREDQMLQQYPDMSEDKLEEIMSMQRKFMTPLWMGIFGIINNTVISFIASLIISIFTRKVDKSFEANFR